MHRYLHRQIKYWWECKESNLLAPRDRIYSPIEISLSSTPMESQVGIEPTNTDLQSVIKPLDLCDIHSAFDYINTPSTTLFIIVILLW